MDVRQIIQINRFALEQLVLENFSCNYVPNEGVVVMSTGGDDRYFRVLARWTPAKLLKRKELKKFFNESKWFEYLSKSTGLVVPMNIGTNLTFPVFYEGKPFLCINMFSFPIADPSDFKSKFIPESVRLVTENAYCRLVKYGKYQTLEKYIDIIKEKPFDEIKSFIDDYIELRTSTLTLGYHSDVFVIDGKLCTLLEGYYDNERRLQDLRHIIRKFKEKFAKNQQASDYIQQYIDNLTPAQLHSEIVRVVPEYKVNEIDSKEVSLDELSKLMKRFKALELHILDMFMRILADTNIRKEFMVRTSISNSIQRDVVMVYIKYFNYARIGEHAFAGRNVDIKAFVKQFKQDPSKLYSYQEKLNEFVSFNPLTQSVQIRLPVTTEKFTLLIRSYNVLKLKSEEAALRSLSASRWENYVPVNPRKVNSALVIGENKYSPLLFYNTPLYNAIVLSEEYNIDEFPYLDARDKRLIELWLQGVIMPMTFYAELSDSGFNNLSTSGSFLDLYENLKVRRLVDLSFVLGESPLEYILGKSEELLKLGLPGVEELLGMLGS